MYVTPDQIKLPTSAYTDPLPTEDQATPEQLELERQSIPDILERLEYLYSQGYTVLASKYKAASLWQWKNPSREQLYEAAKHFISTGKGNSLSLRLDGDIAALDCDFKDERLTDAFIKEFYNQAPMASMAVTVRGKKGCKLFCHLLDKDGISRTIKIGDPVWPGDTDFYNAEDVSAKKCELELKQELSVVYGWHSPGLRYTYLQDKGLAIYNTPPHMLPALSLERIQDIYNKAVERAGFVTEGGIYVSATELESARLCCLVMEYYQKTGNELSPKLLEHFLEDYKHPFELACIRSYKQDRKPTPYDYHVKRVRLRPIENERVGLKTFKRAAYMDDHMQLADIGTCKGIGLYSECLRMPLLELFGRLYYPNLLKSV